MKRSIAFLLPIVLFSAIGSAKAGVIETRVGKPVFQSMGPLAFGPDGVLFIADTRGAAITAVSTGDTSRLPTDRLVKVEGINQKVAGLLGTEPDLILIDAVAVNPISHNAYL